MTEVLMTWQKHKIDRGEKEEKQKLSNWLLAVKENSVSRWKIITSYFVKRGLTSTKTRGDCEKKNRESFG